MIALACPHCYRITPVEKLREPGEPSPFCEKCSSPAHAFHLVVARLPPGFAIVATQAPPA